MDKLSEYDHQARLFSKILDKSLLYVEYKFIFSTLNGIRLSIGQAIKAKRGGNKKGVPDIFWDLKRGNYSGLRIEMKVKKNKLTPEQVEYFDFAKQSGFLCLTCYSCDEAFKAINEYFSGRVF